MPPYCPKQFCRRIYLLKPVRDVHNLRVQELCESRGGRPGLSVLMSLTVSVDVKEHWTVLRHWSQFVPNMSADIRGHKALLHHHFIISSPRVSGRLGFDSPFSSKVRVHGHHLVTLPLTVNETLAWLSSLPIIMQYHPGSDSARIFMANTLCINKNS